jgi:predicted DNA-binding transcriptional regulator AlpA
MKDPTDRKYLDSADVMERYRIRRTALHNWMKEEGFPKPVKIRRRNYFKLADLLAWEERHGASNTPAPEMAKGLPIVSDVIQDYPSFVKAMVSRRNALGLPCLELDHRSGMQQGYANKLENWNKPNGRGMGPEVFPLWLGGLKVGIILVDLPRRPYRKRGVPPSLDDKPAA